MEDIALLSEIAPKLGVSRQAVEQALARAAGDCPQPAVVMGGRAGYRVTEIESWWKERANRRWHERRLVQEQRTIQMNVRIGPDDLATIDQLRGEQETRSAVARRVLRDALAGIRQE